MGFSACPEQKAELCRGRCWAASREQELRKLLQSLQSFCSQQKKASHSRQEHPRGWLRFFGKQKRLLCTRRIMTRAPNVNAEITGIIFATPSCKEQLLGNGTETGSCDHWDYCQTGEELCARRSLCQSIPLLPDTRVTPSPLTSLRSAPTTVLCGWGPSRTAYLLSVHPAQPSWAGCVYRDEARVLLTREKHCCGFTYYLNLKIS